MSQSSSCILISISGIRESFGKLVRKIGIILLVETDSLESKGKRETYLLEVSIDNHFHLYHVDCSILDGEAYPGLIQILEDETKVISQEELRVYLRMIIWILGKIVADADTYITYSYSYDRVISAENLLERCQQILVQFT